MAERKSRPKRKRTGKRWASGGSQKKEIIKAAAGLSFLILLVLLVGFVVHHLLKAPVFEVYPVEKKEHAKPMIKPVLPAPKKLPRVAVIIDDIGYDTVIVQKIIDLDAVITLSVLPFSPFRKKIISDAQKKGIEIMLHLPMEPIEYPNIKPGPGGLLSSMTPDQLITQLNNDIDDIMYIKGVNNHMGSKMTADSERINQVFSILKKRGLFFIDSGTTPDTLCKSSARLLQVPFAKRDIFLDHVQDHDFIRKQLKHLVRIANIRGEAVGIAHPYQQTYDVLKKSLPELKKKVNLVSASQIVHIIN